MRRAPAALLAVVLALGALGACQRGADKEARARLIGPAGGGAAAGGSGQARPKVDWAEPAPLLALDAGEASRRLGSLQWRGAVHFAATRQGEAGPAVDVNERHALRQLATGEFAAEAEIDPGAGPGGLAGKEVVWAGGMTYARGRFAPFRERPTDHGRDARRFRDESFTLLGDVARLCGGALQLTPAGSGHHLGRSGRRFTLALGGVPSPPPKGDGRTFGTGGADADTQRHLAFLDGRKPVAARGEMLLDEETGVVLKGQLSAAFALRDDDRVRVNVEVASELTALGAEVKGVAAPQGALPDDRKPPGVAAALEAAGLKSREKREAAEPSDEEDAR